MDLKDEILKDKEFLEKTKPNMPKDHLVKRKSRYYNKSLKLEDNEKDLSKFGIQPLIDYKKPLLEIEKDIKKYKKTKYWIDEDQLERVTKMKIMSKLNILQLITDYQLGATLK